MALSNRGQEWIDFSESVLSHVENYTVPQYGDAPNDNVESFTVEDLKTQMGRYIARIGKGQRGTVESRRDCLKLAHYACLLASRIDKDGEA